jgi:hypothetical protein
MVRGTLRTKAGAQGRANLTSHRVAEPRRGRIDQDKAEFGETEHGNGCLTSGRSLVWLGAASGKLDVRQRGRRILAKPSGESRAQERVSLREMRQGRECGCGRS